jgi:uncharacterized coiled-coil protein SlyX
MEVHTRAKTSPKRKLNGAGVFTMDDLRARLDAQDATINSMRGDVNLQTGAVQRVETLMKSLIEKMGDEEEDGQGGYVGTGVMGRLRRNEVQVSKLKELYHRWIAFGAGFCACLGTALLVIWWLIGDKLDIVLKGTGHG